MRKTIEIHAYEDGPYVIEGRVTAVGPDGQRSPQPGTAVALCRCGHTEQLPFCDGTHKARGFRADEATVELTPSDEEGTS